MCAEYPRRRLSRHAKNQAEMTGGSERTAGLAPNSLPRAISRALRPISSSQLANDSCAMLIGAVPPADASIGEVVGELTGQAWVSDGRELGEVATFIFPALDSRSPVRFMPRR